MTHILRISHSGSHNSSATPDSHGNYPVHMIRRQLSDSDIGVPNVRTNPSTGAVERTFDSGSTWLASPGEDPRHADSFRMPTRTGSTRRCDAAANAVDKLKSYVDEIIAAANDIAAIAGVLALALTFVPGIDVVVDVFASAIGALSAIGASALNSTMTTTVYNKIEEILYCHMDADGKITAAGLSAIESKILVVCGSAVSVIFNYLMTSLGEVGLSNAGTTGSIAGSCGSFNCQWCYEFDFSLEDHHAFWSADTGYGHWLATGYSGHGAWFGVSAGLILRCNFAATEVTYCEYDVQWTGTPDELAFLWRNGGSTLHTTLVTPVSSPQTVTDTRTLTINQMVINPYGATLPLFGVARVRFYGTGTNPFGSDNC